MCSNGPSPDILDDLITEAELADRLGRSTYTVARYRRHGEGPPFIRLGRQIFYSRTDIDEWLHSARQGVSKR